MMSVVALIVFARIQAVSSSSFLHQIDTLGAKQPLFRGSYAPGLGTDCYGVWTTAWAAHHGDLPPTLEEELNVSDSSLLADVRAHRCPYGVSLPGQVTFPQYGRHENVASLSVLLVIAVFYSYVPYLLAARVVWSVLKEYRRSNLRTIGTTHLYVLLWVLSAIVFQELIFKPIIKQPRPGALMQVRDYTGKYAGSCLQTCGMPSSHSMLAMGWFIILLVDRIYRVQLFRTEPDAGATISEFLKQLISWDPFIKIDTLAPIEFAADMAFWGTLLLPVPIMRVLLFDHSTGQVLLGSIIGVIYAFGWWRLTRWCQRKLKDLEDETIWQWVIPCRCSRPQSENVEANHPGQLSGETVDAERRAAAGLRQQPAEALPAATGSGQQPGEPCSGENPAAQSSWILLRICHDLILPVSQEEQASAERHDLILPVSQEEQVSAEQEVSAEKEDSLLESEKKKWDSEKQSMNEELMDLRKRNKALTEKVQGTVQKQKLEEEEERRKKNAQLRQPLQPFIVRPKKVQSGPLDQQAWEKRLLGAWRIKNDNGSHQNFNITLLKTGVFRTEGDIKSSNVEIYATEPKVKFNGRVGVLEKKDGKDIVTFATKNQIWMKVQQSAWNRF